MDKMQTGYEIYLADGRVCYVCNGSNDKKGFDGT